MILLAQQKNGEILFNESLQQQMNNLLADLQTTNPNGWPHISKDLKVQWRADSSGNWELQLLADLDSRLYRTVPSLQWTPQEHSHGPSTSSCSDQVLVLTSKTGT
jgi:hypothetical protein